MEIRPIRTDKDHQDALVEIDRLWGASIGSVDGDRLDVLATLVERYETTRWPMQSQPPVAVLKFMMEQNGHTQTDLANLLGSRSRASEILNGKRDLSLDNIRRLAKAWRIPAGALLGDLEAV